MSLPTNLELYDTPSTASSLDGIFYGLLILGVFISFLRRFLPATVRERSLIKNFNPAALAAFFLGGLFIVFPFALAYEAGKQLVIYHNTETALILGIPSVLFALGAIGAAKDLLFKKNK